HPLWLPPFPYTTLFRSIIVGPVARRAPDDRRLVADFPASPAIVAQRCGGARTFAVATEIKRDRRSRRAAGLIAQEIAARPVRREDRKSTRLNSSHQIIS